jgi:trans-aconitate 2-methyltransferase
MPWNPENYEKFKAERFQPFEDLAALVRIRPGLKVIDLGCGTGELTRRLADRLPESEVLGIDNSPQMLEKAKAQVRPGLAFERRGIEAVSGTWDLVFSNAAIQWVKGHESLVPWLMSLVRPGGQLVAQVPRGNPAMEMIPLVAGEPPFREALGGWTQEFSCLPLYSYAELLYRGGAEDMVIMEKVYPHILRDAAAIVDWYEGSALLPYLERLGDLGEAFKERYRQRLRLRWPETPVFFGFQRVLFAATRRQARDREELVEQRQ